MARTMLKPDPTRYLSIVQTRVSGPEWPEPEAAEVEPEAGGVPTFQGKEDLPSDFPLDLRLHEILQQARLTTASSGAVIALARGNRMVCRATLGDKAPGVGVCLNTRSGLSGACVQTQEMQLCDDTLVDPRVNATACSDLGIRSIAVQPILEGGELWGMLEIFSLVPHAFSDSDLQELQGLSRKILRTVREAMDGESTPPVRAELSLQLVADPVQTKSPEQPEALPEPVQVDVPVYGRDYRTGALTAAVLALAVLLGWMVGRVGWSMAVNRAPAQAAITSEEAQAMMPVAPETSPAAPRLEEPPVPARPVVARVAPPAKPAPKPKTETAEPAGGLVVYENGKVVFRMPPSKVEAPAAAGVTGSGSIEKAATREEDGSSQAPEQSSSASANSYLLERVEPQYPEAARMQRVQGPVELKVLVGIDGLVRKITTISGNPLLVGAATDAVRQWRFKPHELKSKVVEFETQVTVNFALP
ncbi:MAG: TonB family protein [Terriglobales bacterium]